MRDGLGKEEWVSYKRCEREIARNVRLTRNLMEEALEVHIGSPIDIRRGTFHEKVGDFWDFRKSWKILCVRPCISCSSLNEISASVYYLLTYDFTVLTIP